MKEEKNIIASPKLLDVYTKFKSTGYIMEEESEFVNRFHRDKNYKLITITKKLKCKINLIVKLKIRNYISRTEISIYFRPNLENEIHNNVLVNINDEDVFNYNKLERRICKIFKNNICT